MTYPQVNIFHSSEWQARAEALGLTSPVLQLDVLKGLKVGHFTSGLLSDFERWPSKSAMARIRHEASELGCDWIVARKLLDEQRTEEIPSGAFISFYSNSPYIDLLNPPEPKKTAIAHVYRTERKLTREIGAPVLKEFKDEARSEWFDRFIEFQSAQGRFPEAQRALLKRWVIDGEHPEWMRLLGLVVTDAAGTERLLCCGLFYVWDGVFYYYSSAMSPDPELRKYGPGKLFVEKLIQYAKAEGCRTFDFLQGDHDYKTHWNPTNRPIRQCVLPVSLKGRAALALFKWKQDLKAFRKTFSPEPTQPKDALQ